MAHKKAVDYISSLLFVTIKRNDNPLHDKEKITINHISPMNNDMTVECSQCEVDD